MFWSYSRPTLRVRFAVFFFAFVLNLNSWYLFLRARLDITCQISGFLSSFLLMILCALFMSVSTTDRLFVDGEIQILICVL